MFEGMRNFCTDTRTQVLVIQPQNLVSHEVQWKILVPARG